MVWKSLEDLWIYKMMGFELVQLKLALNSTSSFLNILSTDISDMCPNSCRVAAELCHKGKPEQHRFGEISEAFPIQECSFSQREFLKSQVLIKIQYNQVIMRHSKQINFSSCCYELKCNPGLFVNVKDKLNHYYITCIPYLAFSLISWRKTLTLIEQECSEWKRG